MYVPVLSQESELSCTLLRVSILSLSTIVLLDLCNCCDSVVFFYFYFIIQFPDEPEVRIVSGDTLTISEGQTLTLKCSFDFGIGLRNVKWIYNNNIEIKGFDTLILTAVI